MNAERRVALFRNGANQAVRIPRDMEMDADEALIRREGDAIILEPIARSSLATWLESLTPLDFTLPEIDDPPAEEDPVAFP